MLRSTGDPYLDALIAGNPAIARYLERELRYGQTRWAEVWLACIMAVFGAVLLAPGDTFGLPSFRIIDDIVREDVAGLVGVGTGIIRLIAIWYNGNRRKSPIVRVLGCLSGFFFWLALTIGFVLTYPPLSTGLIYGVLAIAELHSSSRAARDMGILDSLGVRERRRDRERLASGG
ncbi:hypothetical protein [Enterovirga sp. CN4-39]|uniref:hypothetical protein n=1 Tax=Enterovirga sp. CN4-39 TaxID=3400910 RepID=UPI003C0BA574